VYYNHYSWLRTMEDLFDVAAGHGYSPLPAGTVSGGLDGQGHLGYAAQPGLRPFGRDVFNNRGGFCQYGCDHHAALDAFTTLSNVTPRPLWARATLAVGAPLLALMVIGGHAWYSRRRRSALPGRP